MEGEALIVKVVDLLEKWYDGKKEQKELRKKILVSLKASIKSLILHFDLSKEHGHYAYRKLQLYLPNDIEKINEWLVENQLDINNELYDAIYEFINYLVEYNEFISSLSMGCGAELDQYEKNILENSKSLIEKINQLLTS